MPKYTHDNVWEDLGRNMNANLIQFANVVKKQAIGIGIKFLR